MSDQTPPTDAPPTGGYPPPPSTMAQEPASQQARPVAPPVPPYLNPQNSAPHYPSSPPYSGAPPYPQQYPGVPAPSAYPAHPPAGQYAGAYPSAYPVGGPQPAGAPAAKRPGGLGLTTLLLALAAAVIAPIVGAIAAFQVGIGTGSRIETIPSTAWQDLSFLSPVREWVLLGEIAFWAGTVLGIWAIVQGIVAIVKRRGLGTGIASILIAVVALFVFGTVVYAAGIAGLAAGATNTSIGV